MWEGLQFLGSSEPQHVIVLFRHSVSTKDCHKICKVLYELMTTYSYEESFH